MRRRVLISGSREWRNVEAIRRVIYSLPHDALVIHGGCRGADTIADRLARERGLDVLQFDAEWVRYGRSAGPRRNQRMIDEGGPTDAFVFPLETSKGTYDMISRLAGALIPFQVCLR